MKASIVIGSLAISSLAGSTRAAISFYTNEAAFNATLASSSVDTYDDLPAYSPLSVTISRSAGPYSYTANAPNQLYTAGVGADVWLSTNFNSDDILLTPSAGLPTAMGGYFFTSDINGAADPGNLQITVIDVNGTQSFSLVNTSPSTFLGFTSDSTIVQVQVRVSSSPIDVWPAINNLIFGQVVPAPGAASMLGLGWLIVARRRR